MPRRGQSKQFLRDLRRKYKLGEFAVRRTGAGRSKTGRRLASLSGTAVRAASSRADYASVLRSAVTRAKRRITSGRRVIPSTPLPALFTTER